MKSTKLLSGLAGGLAISMLALTAGQALAADYVMKVGLEAPPPDPANPDHSRTPLAEFEQDLEAASGGRIDVQIFWNGQLGKVDNVLNLVRGGQVEAEMAADGHLAPYFSDIQILGVPYIFSSAEVAHEVLDGPAGQMLAEKLSEATDMYPLGWMENGGFRHFTANSPLNTVDDLKGLKIRTMSNPAHMEMVRALGASPTPIPWADLYTSLQTGVVDGEENSLATFRVPRLEEVQKHIIMDGHVYAALTVVVSQKWLDSLPDDLRQAVLEAGQRMTERNRQISADSEASDRAYLESKDVTIVDLSTEEKARFRDLTQAPVLEMVKDSVSQEIVDIFLSEVAKAESGQ
ncbi:TRAP transporter substrate-binding protein [Sinisalibacter aestuarii]|uniref:ABC transporter substrate-binding protein n=1 Tax=Sinisalibacter aestuarii TaxID=2949426 RepID=A0ABQ5LQ13_9RHOB|nr:TRAP transporter substrate-binding protein [Sinisalibacter aestuarii]GKY87038.1 ABC transporter substrate-binding protein [Sinisalibacter aestuarii]